MTAGFAYAGALSGPARWFALAGHWVEQEAGAERGSVIIRGFAHKSLSIMLLGVPRLKRAVLVLVVVLLAGLTFVSCGKSTTPTSGQTSGLKFRALVSQDVTSATGTVAAGILIIDASRDLQAARVSPGGIGSSFQPAMMVESNNRQTTVAVSSDGKSLQVINNSTESVSGTITLPGVTQSVVISVDGSTAYAAVSNAQIPQGLPGGIVAIALGGTTPAITATVPVPGAQYVVQSGDGSRLLAFSNNHNFLDTVTIVSPFNIVAGQQNAICPSNLCTTVSGFDHPVFGFFSSDNSQAWILNCGPECGGQQAGVQVLNLGQATAGTAVAVDGATVGFINHQTLYVAGTPTAAPGSTTPPNNACSGITTAAPKCGRLAIVDLPSMTVTNSLVITDGYHTQMNIQNGQLFIGSNLCSNVFPPALPATGEQRGCLTIVDTVPSSVTQSDVVFPPDNGDVTGLQPVTNRTIMYVVEGGHLRIYDTTTDKIYTLVTIDILGNAVDVKLADF